MNDRPIIQIQSVHKQFGSFTALHDVSLDVAPGEFFSLLGPSGCGKTTLLRLLAGFEQPSRGNILIDGQPMQGVPANRRPTNMVFQSYAIFPHLSVGDNVGYGLRRLRLGHDEQHRRVAQALDQVRLSGLAQRRPHELSGGQRQRVALARALVMRPKVLLLDEPLSALDKKLREHMHVELRQLQRAVGITFVLVTHDQEEALTLSDQIAVMFDGRIAQVGSPEDVYQRPASRPVAEFIGGMNFLGAQVVNRQGNRIELDIAGLGRVDLDRPPHLPAGGHTLTVAIRPERMTLMVDDGATAERLVAAVVVDASYYGDMTYYYLTLVGRAEPIIVSTRNSIGRRVLTQGQRVDVAWSPQSLVVLG